MLKLKKLDKFVLKSFGLLFIATFFICLFIFMMQFLWRYVDDLVGKGLEMTVLGQFFFYSALTLIPASLPLATLLASLITFGNFGERFELLAMKAAGISLFKIIRPLMILAVLLCGISFVFQNNIGPKAFSKLTTLLISIRQKSPELDIPEGIFYDEIDGYNIFVKEKDRKTGLLYDVIIYEFSEGFDNARIIVADTGQLAMTADKQYLYLHLYSGEMFENIRQTGVSKGNVPYRRESFKEKHALIEFDSGFNMADASIMDKQSGSKNMQTLRHSIDSMVSQNDSVGIANYEYAQDRSFDVDRNLSKSDSIKVEEQRILGTINVDSLFNVSTLKKKQSVLNLAKRDIESLATDWSFREVEVKNTDLQIRRHLMAWHEKITLSFACLVFFFIGAPLGSIIRKGGLGMPVVISVLIFIIYYIINTMGSKMAREGEWIVWIGMWMSTLILAPVGGFLAYKSNRDSVILNSDLYIGWIKTILGIRPERHIVRKEVVIEEPNYNECLSRVYDLTNKFNAYLKTHRLLKAASYLKLWFAKVEPNEISLYLDELELIVEELSNSRSLEILNVLNKYPIIPHRAHTRPFKFTWLNTIFGIVFPIGLFFYVRVWIFRVRLSKDIKKVLAVNNELANIIERNK